MKTHSLIALLVVPFPLKGQAPDLKIFTEKEGIHFILYATNSEMCAVSISLELELDNLRSSEEDKKIFVIPQHSKKYKLVELIPVDKGQRVRYRYRFKSNFGDVTLTGYDTAFVYDLPYGKGKGFSVFQGYNGQLSHKNENALNFTMPEGTEVAAREGKVVKIVQHNWVGCPQEECKQFNNFIMIQHTDGSFASYFHLKQNGAVVKAGDLVKTGNLIGFSGNTGWSTGPHLHFVCFVAGIEEKRSVMTLFRIGNGKDTIYLKENKTYFKRY